VSVSERPKLEDLVTVVLLTYNCAERLDRVLDEVLALGVPVVAVDNGSTDGTADVLARRPAMTLVRLARNIGAAGRNVGAEVAETPYVAFCDDDGWYERAGLEHACALLERHPQLALVNARILVGDEERLDPISAEMAQSPLRDRHGIPGAVLLSFMAGAAVARRAAYQQVGGYDPRVFIGGEEETVAFKLAKAGWQMRYVPEVVMHHHPSLANAGGLRAFGMRNTLVNSWLHRRLPSAVRWTAFTLADTPKNRDFLRGIGMAIAGLPWVLRERRPMDRRLDLDLLVLDRRRFAARRSVWQRRQWTPPEQGGRQVGDPSTEQPIASLRTA
jgi:GT2 family glycosyltransferase